MLCKHGLSRHAMSVCVCVSVRLSRSWILSKRINISSELFSPSDGQTIHSFFHTERHDNIPTGTTPLTGTSTAGGIGTNRDRRRTGGVGPVNNKCDNPPCSLPHLRRRISEAIFITACSMHYHNEGKRTEFICTQR